LDKLEQINLEKKGVRAIAVFEAVKGFLAIIAAFALLSLRHKDLEAAAQNLINNLHFDPSGELAQKFVETAGKIEDANFTLVFLVLALYVVVRFVEAYGLWFLKAWAEWFAIISGCLYIPIEIYELLKKPTFTRAFILIFNVAIVLYLFYFRKEQKIEKQIHESQINQPAP
jgi:uncharacterized membrane protein (DUF2068 family)